MSVLQEHTPVKPATFRTILPKANVLLVEEEAIIALDIANDLESWSYEVIGVARSVEQAIQFANFQKPDFAVVDIMLRGASDGLAIAEMLQSQFGTKIIFLTGYDNQASKARIVKLEPIGYLFKPYSGFTLRQLLEAYE